MNNRLYVGNLSYEATHDALQSYFAECGDVLETHVVKDRDTGRARGFAFITMKTEADATHAIAQLNGTLFDGRPLRVNLAEERTDRNRSARGGHRGW